MSIIKSEVVKTFANGLIHENPTFRLVLGMCPTLAITTSAINGIGMGLATMAVMVGSNFIVSFIRKIIPSKIRIPIYITIIATFVTMVQFLFKAYFPSIDKSLGIFIPLIVVNCILLARVEMFAAKKSVFLSVLDAIAMGLGFMISITLIGALRELLGNGTIFGIIITKELFDPALIMILPPGGFLAFAFLLIIVNKITKQKINNIGCHNCHDDCESKCGLKEADN